MIYPIYKRFSIILDKNLTIGHHIAEKKFDTKIVFGQKSNKTIGENIILVAFYYIVWKCWTRKEKTQGSNFLPYFATLMQNVDKNKEIW